MNARGATWLLYGIAAIAPAVACVAVASENPASAVAVINALGRLLGIAGLSLFLVTAVISFRIPGFDRFFGGLTSLWRIHHRMGGIAFLLLLAHPLLLSLAAADLSLAAAVDVLFPSRGGTGVWLGWGALVAMMVFLAPSFSFFGRPDYQHWKHLHRLSGVAALLALGHTFLLERTVPTPWSEFLWGALSLVALSALSYSLLLARRANRYHYQVSEVARPANNVVEISMSPRGKELEYRPGQFVYLAPHDRSLEAGFDEEHPYTISSAPGESRLRVAIKDLGDASRAMQSIRIGAQVRIMGPYGDFFPRDAGAAELWVAGGIGVTPFLSRARHLAGLGQPVDIAMIYCVQDEARALFAEELEALAGAVSGFYLTMHYFYRHGPMDSDFLRYHCRDCEHRQVYICGPDPLLALARHLVQSSGVPRRHIHTEEFNLL